MKCSFGISDFLEEIPSSHSVVFLYFFALIAEEGFLISSLELCITPHKKERKATKEQPLVQTCTIIPLNCCNSFQIGSPPLTLFCFQPILHFAHSDVSKVLIMICLKFLNNFHFLCRKICKICELLNTTPAFPLTALLYSDSSTTKQLVVS